MRILYLLIFILLNHQCWAHKLKEKPISIKLIYDTTTLRIKGEKIYLGFEVEYADGIKDLTRNFGGNLKMKNFQVFIDKGIINAKSHRLSNSKTQSVRIYAQCKKYPEVNTYLDIALHYETDILVKTSPRGFAAPGEKYDLRLAVMYNNGEVKPIGYRSNRLNTKVNGGFLKHGKLHIIEDPSQIINHSVDLILTPISGSMAPVKHSIVLDYNKPYQYTALGFSGSSGANGCGHGSYGEIGENGPTLDVFVDSYFDQILNTELIQVEVFNQSGKRNYLVNPEFGSINICSVGGDGGNGGDGANGRNGQNGRDGNIYTEVIHFNDSTTTTETKQEQGQNGQDGEHGYDGGDGAPGGNGGNIYIHFSKSAEKYLELIKARSIPGDGGDAGNGGRGGNGGSGGSGSPNGFSGANGQHGRNGYSGRDGWSGSIEYHLISEN